MEFNVRDKTPNIAEPKFIEKDENSLGSWMKEVHE